MNSLVVLFSLMALAAAKPSVPAIIGYAAPAVAIAPAAVSHQSRLDIKSTPAIVKTDILIPTGVRTVLAEPVVADPIAYSAPLAFAPAAVSTQSHIDIKSSPAIYKTIATGPVAYSAPIAYNAPLAYSAPYLAYKSPLGLSAPLDGTYTPSIISPAIAPVALKSAIPEAKSEVAPESSEPLLPVAPTETPEVAAARAAHLEAKALEESHQIQKRSVPIVGHTPLIPSYASPILTSYAAAHGIYSPIARVAPIAVSAPVLTGAYGIHPY